MVTDLEEKVLTVTQKTLYEYGSENEEYTSWKMIDDRLIMLPSAFGGKLWLYSPEWTYTIDLDREIFSVNSCIHFSMREIPHDRWILGFNHGQLYGGFSFDVCPEATDKYPAIEYTVEANFRDKQIMLFNQYDCSIVRARNTIDYRSKSVHRKIIAVNLFEQLWMCFKFNRYLPGWNHDDFTFRELAFAILSFAAGQFRFDMLSCLDGDLSTGFFIDPGDDERLSKPRLLPGFATRYHNPGADAGSAPQASIYWFENILVSLEPDAGMQNNPEAAIVKVVEFGFKEGKTKFYAVVFSLVNIIMLEISVRNGIPVLKRTEITSLSCCVEEGAQSTNKYELICQEKAGFVSLMYFFDAAASRELSRFNQGSFPTEIYAMVLASVDSATHKTCAKVSGTFYGLCQETMPFSNDLLITKFTPNPKDENEWNVSFKDYKTGEVYQCDWWDYSLDPYMWTPVIGGERPSILTDLSLSFESLALEMRGLGSKSYRALKSRALLYRRRFGYKLKNLREPTRNLTVSHVEKVWNWYLSRFFHYMQGWPRWEACYEEHKCALIPHYREISIILGSDLNQILWVCLRRSIDGNTPQKQTDTLTYVAARLLKNKERQVDNSDVVMIIYGLTVEVHNWKPQLTDEIAALLSYAPSTRIAALKTPDLVLKKKF